VKWRLQDLVELEVQDQQDVAARRGAVELHKQERGEVHLVRFVVEFAPGRQSPPPYGAQDLDTLSNTSANVNVQVGGEPTDGPDIINTRTSVEYL
jgi:hypothetical protein